MVTGEETSRDFCYVDNVVQANVLAAFADKEACKSFYNIALGDTTSLKNLYRLLATELTALGVTPRPAEEPEFAAFRAGDIRHSLANISRAKKLLGFEPSIRAEEGFKRTVQAYHAEFQARKANS